MTETIPETEKSTERIQVYITKSEKIRLMSLIAKRFDESGGNTPTGITAFIREQIFTPWLKKQK